MDSVEALAKKIAAAVDTQPPDFEKTMQAVILYVGVEIGVHAESKKALDATLERFTDAVTNVAKHRFSTKTVVKSDFDDGNWGSFGSP